MMNPIFSRRYKGGSRPNIVPTTAKRQNYTKTTGTSGGNSNASSVSSSSMSSGSGSGMSTFSMGDSQEEPNIGEGGVSELKSPEREDNPQLFTKSSSQYSSSTNSAHGHQSPGESASRLLAQQLLASKQNMLAQSFLTPQENRERAKLGGGTRLPAATEDRFKLMKATLMKQSFSTESFSHSLSSTESICNNSMPKSPTVHDIGLSEMTLCDIEDQDEGHGNAHETQSKQTTPYFNSRKTPTASNYFRTPSEYPCATSRTSRPNLNQMISKEPIDLRTWRDMKLVVCGNYGSLSYNDGWIGQGFVFDPKIPFGLVQKKGGPCGVLAVVQSLIIRNLLFGSPFSFKSENEKKRNLEEISAFLSSGGFDEGMDVDGGGVMDLIRKERVDCLVDAIAEILWTCGELRHELDRHEKRKQKRQERTTLIMFGDRRAEREIIFVTGRAELRHFLQNSIHRFDCTTLVYSATLTRGIPGIREDFDFENCTLIGQHGYCSQELINLLTFGRAISNTFDNEIELEGKILKGIPGRCDIGLLSLFEHYDSIKIGNFLKCPRFPIWIICSESHFSVMFSTEIGLCNSQGADDDVYLGNESFDLFYFDGLSRQEKVIRLSIRSPNARDKPLKKETSIPSPSPPPPSFPTFPPSSTSSEPCAFPYIPYDALPNEMPIGYTGAVGYGASAIDYGSSDIVYGASALVYGAAGGSDHTSSSITRDEDLIPPLEKCIRTKWPGALVDWNDTEPIL